jgi:cystathionine beta-synthase
MVAAVKGYKSIIVMPDKMSKEKIDTLKAYGAEVVLTPSGVEAADPRSHYSVAKKLAETTSNSFYANQFHNEDNIQTHYETTGPEIWEQMGGKIDAIVNGAGTGGTISGIGKYLKEKNPNIQIIMADPVGSILYDLYYHKEVRTPPSPYLIEGIGEDMLPGNMKFEYVDEVIQFNDQEAMQMCREMVRKEGLFIGPSSAATMVCALKWAKKQKEPKRIVTFLCDNGDRYLSKVFNDDWMKKNNLL